jgi:adenine-specific DNA-methyltransferase
VSAVDAANLRERGLQPGSPEWEEAGICRSVTWPRSKYTIAGKRDDDATLEGDYLTGRTVMVEKARKFVHLNFVDSSAMTNAAQKRQLMSALRGLPSTVDDDRLGYFVSEESPATILFSETDADSWLSALDGQNHVTTVYIVASTKKIFEQLKASIADILNPITVVEDEKRPLSLGFKSNLAYFRLAFLDKDRVALRRAFSEILPLLWFKAGAIGSCPTISPRAKDDDVFLPKSNPFAVLLRETAIAKLLSAIAPRNDIDYIFIVTDDEDAFREISAEVLDARTRCGVTAQCYQLYRDYLENFVINRSSFENGELREAAE